MVLKSSILLFLENMESVWTPPPPQMVQDSHFLRLNVNDSYSYNINSVELSDQLQNVYRVNHWMWKYKWWWYIFSWGHGLVLFNDYIIYKNLSEEGKVNPMSNYHFWRLVCLVNIYPKMFGGRENLVSEFQQRGIWKNDLYTPPTTVLARRDIRKKQQD